MYIIEPRKNRDWILEQVPQEQIMEYYLNIAVQTKHKFKSPLRQDNNPSCVFFYTKQGKLYYRDFSKSESLDCFDIASIKLGLDFKSTLKQVISDFNLNTPGKFVAKSYKHLESDKQSATNTASHIEVIPLLHQGNWHMNSAGIEYWDNLGITPATLRFYRVMQLELARCNKKTVYFYDKNIPGYAYYFGGNLFKLYFPLSTGIRFLQNTNKLQGELQLPNKSSLLVVTKSMKDVMLFYEYGIAAVAPQSESFCFDETTVQDWQTRFKKIVIVYDYDYTGVKFANKWRKKYNWDYAFVSGAKDITDLYLSSPYAAEQWIHQLVTKTC